MGSPIARAALGVAVLVVAIALLIVLREDGGEETAGGTATTESPAGEGGSGYGNRPSGGGEQASGDGQRAAVETIVVRGGEPVGGVRELEYDAGDRVRFRVRSDVADEVHVHGYDLTEDVAAGGTVAFSFPADIEGIFEVELERLAVQIAELRVNP